MSYFLLHKNGRARLTGNSLYINSDGQLCVWASESDALDYAEQVKTSWETWRVRPACSADFAEVARRRHWSDRKPAFVVMDVKEMTVTKRKTDSANCLVEIFEDLENRRVAISTKAASEDEFVVEFADAVGKMPADGVNWSLRLRELMPLAVDICCKYRGYRADTVRERRELIAGDLEFPKQE